LQRLQAIGDTIEQRIIHADRDAGIEWQWLLIIAVDSIEDDC
jgi:hypothetical protein